MVFKMKKLFVLFLFSWNIVTAQISVELVGSLPEAVANNAVCEGFINNEAYLFSFGGIDATKQFDGIHLKSFRYNIETGEAIQLADLPDTMGKIAAGASRIGNIIYIAGGYHVFPNGSEISSNKMHRYDIENDVFLSDGADIPIPIDDHIQAVWKDSLIFIATGWSNSGNVPNVQIYNPTTDEWLVGDPMPNFGPYMSFGASGTILNDTLYFFGGATSEAGFGPQSRLRIGAINPTNPTEIAWSISTPSEPTTGYRSASINYDGKLYWIGGSYNTYNYNGIAYDGSGGVPLNNRILWISPNQLFWSETKFDEIPMDLRGIAEISDRHKYIAGGMIENQVVTDKIYKITFNENVNTLDPSQENFEILIGPNPFQQELLIYNLEEKILHMRIYDSVGKEMHTQLLTRGYHIIELSNLVDGLYYVQIENKMFQKVIRQNK